ncbi:hypothetical protein ACQKWADRAFT_303353 [Trichoderma austrokoningii]
MLPSAYPFSPYGQPSLERGLHLTHLRSPRRVSSSRDPGSVNKRYYQFISRYVIEPTEIKAHMGLSQLEFFMEQEDLSKRPITSEPPELPMGELSMDLPISRHFNHSQRYRLRMCVCRQLKSDEEISIVRAKWPIIHTQWPSHCFITFNGEIMTPLLKQHFSVDLPIELTNSLVKGVNRVQVQLPGFSQNVRQNIAYYMAIEVVIALDHDSTCALVTSAPHFSFDETKNKIMRRLRLDTDEVIIESDTLTVSVTDYFSSKLFEIPVRGRSCLHLECLDLENWLNSRPCKPSPEAGEPTKVDVWGCPLCGEDARPCNLQVDDYFAQMRDKLLEQQMSNVKKIQLNSDGTWTTM